MKKIIAALLIACTSLVQAQTFVRQGGAIYDASTGAYVGHINLNTGKEERLTATLGSGLSATAVICTDAAKALTSTCTSATPSFGATTVTTLNGNTFTTGSSTYTGTAGQTYTFPTTSATIARTDAANTFTGTQTIGALVATTVNGNTITTGSSTYTGTAAQTYTFPTTSATIARTDAANTFTGVQTFNGQLTTSAGFQFRVADNTSYELIRYSAGTNNPAIFCKTVEASDRIVCTASGSIGATEYWLGAKGTDGVVKIGSNGILVSAAGTLASQFRTTQTTVPTCSSNCGTSPSVAGTDTAGIVTMGASGVPASGWVVTFNGTWAAAPACMVQMYLAGMVVGKQPLTVATSTTTLTVVTNGTAPSTSDKYAYHCIGVS